MSDEISAYGFAWGPMEVTRMATVGRDTRVLRIKTEHRTLEVYVSSTGRSVRVFEAGQELKPQA